MVAAVWKTADISSPLRSAAAALDFSRQPRVGGAPRRRSAMPYKRGKSWIAQWIEDGRRRFRACPTKSDAIDLERTRRSTEWRIKERIIKRGHEASNMPIPEALAAFKSHLDQRAADGAISRVYAREQHRAAGYAADMLGIILICEADEHALADLLAALRKRKLSSASMNLYVGALRELHRFTIDGPRRKVERTAPRQVSRVLTPTEAWRIIAHPKRGTFYAFCLFTGLRWNEVARLTWSMVDLEAEKLTIPWKAMKTKRDAVLPIPSILMPMLRAMQCAVGGVRLFKAKPRRTTWMEDLKAAKIPYEKNGETANRKCLRKTFTNWLLDARVSNDVRKALRRDAGGVMEQHYDEPGRFLSALREASEKMVRMFENARRTTGATA